MGILKMLYNGQLIEGHPIGINKIIKGNLQKKEWVSNGEVHSLENTDGEVLYDRKIIPSRPWFILVYESGKRCVD